ncbi:MAG: DUF58 domain-containing protein [Gammaproteobacteria bacterium]|nr:DUF58 domain-containing protein [Gammaproteobacteria bacterium]
MSMWWLSTKWSQRAEKFRTRRFKSWLDRRVPPAQAIRLTHRNIFIVPTRQGFGFVLILLLVLIAGINYQNALAHALAFLMLGLFLVAMLQTYRNLAGLVLSQTVPIEGFVGQKISVAFQVQSDVGRVYDGLFFYWPNLPVAQGFGVDHNGTTIFRQSIPAHRGWYEPGRLRLETVYPFGLFRAWSWLDFDCKILSYPKPVPCEGRVSQEDSELKAGRRSSVGADDVKALRDFQDGDDQRHIHWRASAKLDRLTVKSYESQQSSSQWLRLAALEALPMADRLGGLAYLIEAASKRGDAFGLDLYGQQLPVASGPGQERKALKRLALFDWPGY